MVKFIVPELGDNIFLQDLFVLYHYKLLGGIVTVSKPYKLPLGAQSRTHTCKTQLNESEETFKSPVYEIPPFERFRSFTRLLSRCYAYIL